MQNASARGIRSILLCPVWHACSVALGVVDECPVAGHRIVPFDPKLYSSAPQGLCYCSLSSLPGQNLNVTIARHGTACGKRSQRSGRSI